ncbi:hypothetical protein MRX96_055280 [Rhipicephalus microplus]
MFNSSQLGLATEDLDEEHLEPPPLYPPWQCPVPPLEISQEDTHLTSALVEQPRKFYESGFNVPPPKKPRIDRYCFKVVPMPPPRVHYDSSYFPDELKVSKMAKKTKRSSQTSVAQARREDETACDSDDEGEEESTEKSSESGIGDEEKGESDEEEMEEATDYVHNYYDDFEDDGAFIEDNFDDATFF